MWLDSLFNREPRTVELDCEPTKIPRIKNNEEWKPQTLR